MMVNKAIKQNSNNQQHTARNITKNSLSKLKEKWPRWVTVWEQEVKMSSHMKLNHTQQNYYVTHQK